jgi:uncharacterized protein (DUF1330 family)
MKRIGISERRDDVTVAIFDITDEDWGAATPSVRPEKRLPRSAPTGAKHPIHMLNLVRLRERAIYPDGRERSGAEAYAAYARQILPIFARLGGSIVWRGKFEFMLIGPPEERWDLCFIAQYPSVAAFVEMARDPVYRAPNRPSRPDREAQQRVDCGPPVASPPDAKCQVPTPRSFDGVRRCHVRLIVPLISESTKATLFQPRRRLLYAALAL